MKYIIRNKSWKYLVCAGLLSFYSCTEAMLGEQPKNSPSIAFEYLWQEVDKKYSLFSQKDLDWQQVYDEFAPQIEDQMSDSELFDLFSEMLAKLDDGHVWIVKPNPGFKRFDSGPTYPEGTFDLDLIKGEMEIVKTIGDPEEPLLLYGKFNNLNIGYLYLDHLGDNPSLFIKHLEVALDFLSGTDQLIFDARGIEGGDDRSAQAVAGFFADADRLYMKTRFKTGPGHEEFGNWIDWHVSPQKKTYLKPVALLTDRGTGSAGETFTLAMRKNPQVTIVGNLTYGAFSDNPKSELPNGWILALSTGDFRDDQGISYEGIGLTPDELVINTPEEIQNGMDRTALRAISILLGY